MSRFCFCVISYNNDCEKKQLEERICIIVHNHNYGVTFGIDWDEPVVSSLKTNTLLVNITDSIDDPNSDMFLLPDEWILNGRRNTRCFNERMQILNDLASEFNSERRSVEFYIGDSGTEKSEFINIEVSKSQLVEVLKKTIGRLGDMIDVHIVLKASDRHGKDQNE